MPEMQRAFFYTTLGCHLCETAEAIALPLCHEKGMRLEAVDIATDDSLIARYGVRIPVIRLEGREDELGWPFDRDGLLHYLSGDTPGS